MVKTLLTEKQLETAKKHGVELERVNARIKSGWAIEKAVTTPVKRYNKDNRMPTWIEAAKEYGVSEKTFRTRLSNGWSPEFAITTPLSRKPLDITPDEQVLLDKNGVSRDTFAHRLRKGWDRDKALKTPLRNSLGYRTWGGIRVDESLIKHGRSIGLSYDKMYNRIANEGYDVHDACTLLSMKGVERVWDMEGVDYE